jgi:hypothetical protein
MLTRAYFLSHLSVSGCDVDLATLILADSVVMRVDVDLQNLAACLEQFPSHQALLFTICKLTFYYLFP